MLGLRLVRGCQIDVHQGDPARFVCDIVIPLGGPEQVRGGPEQVRGGPEQVRGGPEQAPDFSESHYRNDGAASAYFEALVVARQQGARHVAFLGGGLECSSETSPETALAAMRSVRRYIEAFGSNVIRRFTFVLSSNEHYKLFQATLFREFPEEE